MEDNSVQIKKDLETFLYHLRIDAEVRPIRRPYKYDYLLFLRLQRSLARDFTTTTTLLVKPTITIVTITIVTIVTTTIVTTTIVATKEIVATVKTAAMVTTTTTVTVAG